jgi:hypothetical protein
MSTYLSNYQHDIFVSYAHVDNQPFAGADKGWVTTLIKDLKNYLGKKLGRSDAYSLWLDNELRGNTAVTPDTLKQLENTATLILILSPGYLASNWCHLELNTFLAKVGKDSGRVFVVEHDVVKERHTELSDLRGYPFWVRDDTGKYRILAIPKPNPETEPEYYQVLDNLACELTDKLKALKEEMPSQASFNKEGSGEISPVTTSTPKATIFLAEVTDDLTLRREEVKLYLESQGVQVLPKKMYFLPTQAELEQAIDADLKQSVLFVQLLSALQPQRPAGMSTPLVQYHRAQNVELPLPILQWRSRDLDIKTVDNPEQRALLMGSTVMAIGLVELQQTIIQSLKKLAEKPHSPQQTSNCDLVFINATSQDMHLAHQVEGMLSEQGLDCCLPLDTSRSPSSAKIREDLNNNLQYCDIVLMLYDINTDEVWVRSQLLLCKRARGKREEPFKVIAVCKHPETPPLNMRLADLHVFDCLPLSHQTCVSQFIMHTN